MGHMAILNRVVRIHFTKKVHFEQSLKKVRELARWISEERAFRQNNK